MFYRLTILSDLHSSSGNLNRSLNRFIPSSIGREKSAAAAGRIVRVLVSMVSILERVPLTDEGPAIKAGAGLFSQSGFEMQPHVSEAISFGPVSQLHMVAFA